MLAAQIEERGLTQTYVSQWLCLGSPCTCVPWNCGPSSSWHRHPSHLHFPWGHLLVLPIPQQLTSTLYLQTSKLSCGVELHNEFIIPVGELLPNKICNSTSIKTVIPSRIVFFIFLHVGPVDPPHITHYRLLVQQDCLIEILLFICVEPVINNSPSPGGIWI